MMKYVVTVNTRQFDIDITENGEGYDISLDGKRCQTSIVNDQTDRRFLMLLDSQSYDTEVFRGNGSSRVFLHGREFECRVEDQRLAAIRRVAGINLPSETKDLHAPMPGLVVKILRAVGEKVRKGEPLLVVEAMKMENELKSPTDGTIKEIAAVVGRPVDKGAVLVKFQS
jgi:biotin carboxyl carrier protein